MARRGRSCALDLAERRRFVELVDLGGDMTALVLEEVGDGAAQRRIGDVMRRMRRYRHIAARDLVLSAGAGLDAGELVLDGVLDRLIIADFEMQERVLLDAAPVAAEQRVGADEVDGARDP